MDRPKKTTPKKTFTDETIAAIFGEDQESDPNRKVQAKFYITEKQKNLIDQITKEEGITRNAYLLGLIKADMRRRGYL